MSTFTMLPAMKVENISLILAGGGLMTVIGLAYLVLEDFILSDFTTFKTKSKRLGTSRTLVGIQVRRYIVVSRTGQLI
jgi:phosphatidylinositol glycan class N